MAEKFPSELEQNYYAMVYSAAEDPAKLAKLRQSGVDINSRTMGLETALHQHAALDNLTAARNLLDAGAEVNALSQLGHTPLYYALSAGTKMTALLLARGADANQIIDCTTPPLNLAVVTGDPELVRLLVKHKASLGAHEAGIDPPAVVVAAEARDAKILRLLHEEFGADLDLAQTGTGIRPLTAAIKNHAAETFEYLLSKGADIHYADASQASLLHVAASADNDDAAAALADKGLPLNAVNDIGYTPLMTAVLANAVKTVAVLLEKGADVGFTAEGSGHSAHQLARESGCQPIIDLIEREQKRRRDEAAEREAQCAHAGASMALTVRKPLSFRKSAPRL